MTGAESRNVPGLLELARVAYRGPGGLASIDGRVHARSARRAASSARSSLEEPDPVRLEGLLPTVLDAAVALTGADLGNIQLLHPASGSLTIVTQAGFGSEFLDYFAVVNMDDNSACGRAARHRAQTVIADVDADPGFAPHRAIADASGFRAVQSTPLTDEAGDLVGVLSTHFRHPGGPEDHELRLMELYGKIAGEAIARHLGRSPVGAAPRSAAGEKHDSPSQAVSAPAALAGEAVQRIFAAGLNLADARAIVRQGAADDLLAAAAHDLDHAIRDIWAMMYDLR
jgi:GAF domain-containing protein